MPLSGISILDVSAYAPGRYASMLLGDFGADVIAVEAPAASRSQSDSSNDAVTRSRKQGTNPTYRSRRSIGINLKESGGRDVLLRLAATADVFLEGFRPGTCTRLGISYEDISRVNPDIVYCSITGGGQAGPDAQKAGHDLNYLADAGVLAMTTRPGQAPGIPGNVLADYAAGGLQAAFAILVGLRQRDQTGVGVHLDVSMVKGLVALAASIEAWRAAGDPDPSWGQALVSGAAPFYDCYETADGQWLSVAPLEPKFYRRLCELLERPDLFDAQARPEEWPRLRAELTRTFASHTREHWLNLFAGEDTCVTAVATIAEAFASGREAGFVHDVARVEPIGGLYYHGSLRPTVTDRGQHTREILSQAGLSAKEIDALLADGSCFAAAASAG